MSRSFHESLAFLGDEDFDENKAGKKAAHLHILHREGFRVPDGFVIADDVALPSITDADLVRAVKRIGGFPVAVRSSGSLEDLGDASFAGQYESYLNVGSVVELRAFVMACRASAYNERVQAYLADRGLDPMEAKVAVLVQRMVDAQTAGVAFSIDPVSGKQEHALVECCAGLGEKLVSGRITPTRYVLDLRTGTVVEHHEGAEGAVITERQAKLLSLRLLQIQAYFGRPQDVEWAIDEGGVVRILQSRPITTVQWRTDLEEFTNADFKDGGISARVCTPLMYSLYENAMQYSMQGYFERIKLIEAGRPETWIQHVYGRGYWNASAVKRALAKVPGFREEQFDQDLGIQKNYGEAGAMVVPTNVKTIARALPVALALESEYDAQLVRARAFAAEFPGLYQGYRVKIARFAQTDRATFMADFVEVLHGFHARTEREYFSTIYNNTNAQTDFKGLIDKIDDATGRKTSVTTLMMGLDGGVHHMRMQQGIVGLYATAKDRGISHPDFKAELASFLDEFGFHSDAELDLTVPRWSEVPERLEQTVADYLWSGMPPHNPADAASRQRQQFEDEKRAVEEAISSRLSLRMRFSKAFRKHLARVRTYLATREEMREYSTQCYAIVRAYVLEAGRRLHATGKLQTPEGVFMLSIDELRDLVQGLLSPTEASEEVRFRKLMFDGYRDFVPPNELGRGVEQRARASALVEVDGKSVLQGLGCSPGVVEATVRVIPDLASVQELEPGDILVTKFTDPGWTPALGMVSGVITEVGGVLSHAAVIGREYGIPAILDLPGATDLLKSGMRVRIDGSSGIVEVLGDDNAEGSGAFPAVTAGDGKARTAA